jgi:hypothetical protein
MREVKPQRTQRTQKNEREVLTQRRRAGETQRVKREGKLWNMEGWNGFGISFGLRISAPERLENPHFFKGIDLLEVES